MLNDLFAVPMYPPYQPHLFQQLNPVYLCGKNQGTMRTPKSAAMFAKVDEWKNSGQTLREFASTLGLSKSAFEYWVRKKRQSSGNSPAFVELSPLVKARVITEATSKHPESDAQAQIVFTFPGGMCIKVYG